ncbi:Glycosyltransferase involved in cell wall bisynthesis [Tangfeifania diversioriginum]|uniref:Glycosyltransferase involved in cell wall bisynthesis n=1 Tax=Tangfeifania diversioriginum TaxID=1168035 RepID=A0A1M6AEW4_9BACT|nr:glycosyltransferase family 2 protein [Tangfeifania diversioriginum]SHI34753.1 Glycosyltransferase involved in cell wall bisynthesis [Tangfeifania diversioriginum]
MISVVIPLLNEEQLVERLLDEVFHSLEQTNENFEVVCVNDGSTDSTLQKLIEIRGNREELKIISLSRNFGLQAALTAGLEYARGDNTIIMDGDFQDPPELIPVLFNKMKTTGADIVTAVRESRSEKYSRKIYINIFHRIFDKISDEQQVAKTGNFCILNKKAHQAILQFTERNRYLPGIRNFIGFKHEFVLYDRPDRLVGEAKMSRKKLFSLAADAIYSFSKWPIRACLYLGILGVFFFLVAIIYTLGSKFLGFAPIGWSSMFLTISFFGSVQLTFLGLIGEYVYRIFKEVQGRPHYFVQEVYE